MIMSFNIKGSIDSVSARFLNDKVLSCEDAVKGASYIIAEWISDNASYRKWIRNYIYRNGSITSIIKKNANDNDKIYEMYYDYHEPIKYIKSHRVLAINRGEAEGILNVSITSLTDEVISYLDKKNY